MIQAFFGNEKGKTTATVGSAVQYVGCANRVLFVSLSKNNNSAECKVLGEIEGVEALWSDEHDVLKVTESIAYVSDNIFENKEIGHYKKVFRHEKEWN